MEIQEAPILLRLRSRTKDMLSELSHGLGAGAKACVKMRMVARTSKGGPLEALFDSNSATTLESAVEETLSYRSRALSVLDVRSQSTALFQALELAGPGLLREAITTVARPVVLFCLVAAVSGKPVQKTAVEQKEGQAGYRLVSTANNGALDHSVLPQACKNLQCVLDVVTDALGGGSGQVINGLAAVVWPKLVGMLRDHLLQKVIPGSPDQLPEVAASLGQIDGFQRHVEGRLSNAGLKLDRTLVHWTKALDLHFVQRRRTEALVITRGLLSSRADSVWSSSEECNPWIHTLTQRWSESFDRPPSCCAVKIAEVLHSLLLHTTSESLSPAW